MALLKQCFCYSLRQGSFIIGSYSLVVYCVAFAVELWWIVESLLILPAPAYTLCALYFFDFIMAAILLFGLLVRQRKYLMSWTLMTVLSFFPEAGMVLFMSLYYWPAHKFEYGVIELVYWSLRAIFNIFGAVCVCSLYLTWRDEELILGRLHDLTLANVETGSGGVGVLRSGNFTGTLKGNSNLAYQNYAYVDSSPGLPDNLNYKNSNNFHRGLYNTRSFTMNSDIHQATLGNRGASLAMKSEFNPAMLFDPAYRKSRISELGIAGIGLEPPGQIPIGTFNRMNRSRSLWNVTNEDYWNRPPPSRPVSLGYVNHIHQMDQMAAHKDCCFSMNNNSNATMNLNKQMIMKGAFGGAGCSQGYRNPIHGSITSVATSNYPIAATPATAKSVGGGGHHDTCGLHRDPDHRRNWLAAGRRAHSVDGLNHFYNRYYGRNIAAHHNLHPGGLLMDHHSQDWSKSSLCPDEQCEDLRNYQDIAL